MNEWLEFLIRIYIMLQALASLLSGVWFTINDNHSRPFCFFIKCSWAAFKSDRVSLAGKILTPIVDLLLLPSSIVVFILGLILVGVVRLFTTKEGFEDLFG